MAGLKVTTSSLLMLKSTECGVGRHRDEYCLDFHILSTNMDQEIVSKRLLITDSVPNSV